jgi:hypothetical protein
VILKRPRRKPPVEPLRKEDVLAYLNRPWHLFDDARLKGLGSRTPEQLLHASDRLREWRHSVAGVATNRERAEDFANHVRLKALLERAGARRDR